MGKNQEIQIEDPDPRKDATNAKMVEKTGVMIASEEVAGKTALTGKLRTDAGMTEPDPLPQIPSVGVVMRQGT